MGEVGFGLLTTSMAAGGVVGVVSYGWLERHVSLGNIMRAGLVLETLTHVVPRRHHRAADRAGDLLRLRRARLHLGHDVEQRAPARGADRAAGAGRAAST